MTNTTKETYDALYAAYDQFNDALFDGGLPPVMLVLHRQRGACGYFWDEQWTDAAQNEKLPEIALNPDHMGRTPREVLSTLVHEMVHQWDALHNEVPTHGHGKTWGAKMDEVGLTPTSTGEPGGKRTGRKVTHMIVDGGPYDVAFQNLKGVDLRVFTTPTPAAERKRDLSKVKHSCKWCGTNVWGKLGIEVSCCDDVMMPAV